MTSEEILALVQKGIEYLKEKGAEEVSGVFIALSAPKNKTSNKYDAMVYNICHGLTASEEIGIGKALYEQGHKHMDGEIDMDSVESGQKVESQDAMMERMFPEMLDFIFGDGTKISMNSIADMGKIMFFSSLKNPVLNPRNERESFIAGIYKRAFDEGITFAEVDKLIKEKDAEIGWSKENPERPSSKTEPEPVTESNDEK